MEINMTKFATKSEATTFLKALGLKKNYSMRGREYWWKGDGSDTLLDHSATIDKIGGIFYIANFL